MWVITMLGRSPKNGAEIMDEIEMMTQGWWRPSPGSVYPLLEGMVQEGLVRKKDDGRYELTNKAKEDVEAPFWTPFRGPRSLDEMLNEIGGFMSYFEDIAKSDKSKLAPFRGKMKSIVDRLSKLVD